MDAKELKRYLYLEDKIVDVLRFIGMKSINDSNPEYISCGMPDGDNKSSTIVYKEEDVGVKAYTRDIGGSDIISLVSFVKDLYFSKSIKLICDIVGIDYYGKVDKRPKSLMWLDYIYSITENVLEEEEVDLEKIDESYLDRFVKSSNRLFYDDGIDDKTQLEFELMICMESGNIIIPIRDELNSLVGVKARKFTNEDVQNKYYYAKRFPKSKILYGLNKTFEHIKKTGIVFIFESEKSVMKAWSRGVRNSVAISGHNISKTQAKKISHLGVDIVFCYDKDVGKDENGNIDYSFYKKEASKFFVGQKIEIMFDFNNLLKEKESPIDNFKAFKKIYKERVCLNNEI